MARFKVACVGYTNSWPLTRHLDPELFDVTGSVPSEAARKLSSGEADVGLIPVASLFSDGDYNVVPGIALGCDGAVGSVLLVGETPIEEWDSVALDGASRTSVVLAQILLRGPLAARLGGRELRLFPVDPGSPAFHAQGKTGAVVIGDAARNLPDRLTTRIDLGEEWKAWTGLPFVFAVCAGRKDLPADAIAGLRASAAKGLPERASAPAKDVTYLTEQMRYELDDRALMGLRRFAALGKQAGFWQSEDVCLYGPPRTRVRVDLDTPLSKGADGERLTYEEGVRLATQGRIEDLGNAAHLRRMALHPGKEVTYIISRNINYTNVCVTACKFCAFYRPKNHKEAYTLTKDQIAGKLDELVKVGGIETLLQGGLNLALGIEYYEDLFHWMKAGWPGVALHALSPEEVFHIMNVSKLTMDQTLDRLIAAGMDSIPGGGAEVLVDSVRKRIAPLKCSSDEWLEVMRQVHKRGLRSSATMMFGMGETSAHRVEHLVRLRDLQDEYNGFTAFICWTFQPEHTKLRAEPVGSGEYLRMQALSRIYLDNIPNVQSSWVTQGPKIGQIALKYGANDFGSVMMEENVVSSAGTSFRLAKEQIEELIGDAGYAARRRDNWYRLVE